MMDTFAGLTSREKEKKGTDIFAVIRSKDTRLPPVTFDGPESTRARDCAGYL